MITLEELRSKIDKNARLIGLDLGKKRIGVSICDHKRIIATPFKTIEYVDQKDFIAELKEIIDQEKVKAIVVGNPLNMDGSKGPSSQSALDKAKMIENRTNIPVVFWYERLSTVGAFKLSSQLDINVSKRIKKIDENAATFILQGAIEFLNN
mgnify:CR=1 FL=1